MKKKPYWKVVSWGWQRDLTPFEQKAYDLQFKKRNRVNGPELGDSFVPDCSNTKSDRDILIAVIGLVAFIILLILL